MAGRKKNFVTLEKNLLIEILKHFKTIIENKKTDSVSTGKKKAAWISIAEKFNSSPLIIEPASGEQLRRLWQNLKTRQRDALTRERQHRMATGGGGPCADAEIDPNIAEISPALFVEVSGSTDSDCNVSDVTTEEEVLMPLQNTDHTDYTMTTPTTIDGSQTSDGIELTAGMELEATSQHSGSTQQNNTEFLFSSNEKKLRVQILKSEYINRERRANELHLIDIKFKKKKNLLEIEILKKQLEEASAKAESAHSRANLNV